MGVMSCHRKGCNEIMCDTYINDIGYICYDCQREFDDYLSNNNIVLTTEYGIKNELKKFMKTEKGGYDDNVEISVDDFFKQNTRRW